MSSTSETGHARNVARFTDVINAVTSFGASYNPSAPDLTLSALNQLKSLLDAALVNVRNAETYYKNSVNTRQIAYDAMSKLSTRIYNALIASGINKEQIKDATGMHKKVTGRRVGVIPAPKPPAPAPEGDTQTDPGTTGNELASKVKNSVSQMSFDNRLQSFSDLVAFASSIPNYSPNEPDLQSAALASYIADLPQHNNLVSTSLVAQATARIDRDKLLYLPGTGALSIASRVKRYVKSIFGADSPEYRLISSIQLKQMYNSITA